MPYGRAARRHFHQPNGTAFRIEPADIPADLHGEPDVAIGRLHQRVRIVRGAFGHRVFGDPAAGGIESTDVAGRVSSKPDRAVRTDDAVMRPAPFFQIESGKRSALRIESAEVVAFLPDEPNIALLINCRIAGPGVFPGNRPLTEVDGGLSRGNRDNQQQHQE
jgi:hypothetical protein